MKKTLRNLFSILLLSSVLCLILSTTGFAGESSSTMSGALNVFSTPSQAKVYIDGEYKGQTPLILLSKDKIPIGKHELRITLEGYSDWVKEIEIMAYEGTNITAKLKRAYNPVDILSLPEGADVYIDGEYKGKTPLSLSLADKIAIGSHRVKLSLGGYKDWEKKVHVLLSEERTIVKAKLEKSRGMVEISSIPSSAKIYIDGEYKGDTPLSLYAEEHVDFGHHNLRLSLDNYRDWSKEFDFKLDDEIKIEANLVMLPKSPEEVDLTQFLPPNSKIDNIKIGNTDMDPEEEIVVAFRVKDEPRGQYHQSTLMVIGWDGATSQYVKAWQTEMRPDSELGSIAIYRLDLQDLDGDRVNEIVAGSSPYSHFPLIFVYKFESPQYTLISKPEMRFGLKGVPELLVVDHNRRFSSDGKLQYISGNIENVSEMKAYNVRVMVSIFDRDTKELRSSSVAYIPVIEAESSTPFELMFPREIDRITYYKVEATVSQNIQMVDYEHLKQRLEKERAALTVEARIEEKAEAELSEREEEIKAALERLKLAEQYMETAASLRNEIINMRRIFPQNRTYNPIWWWNRAKELCEVVIATAGTQFIAEEEEFVINAKNRLEEIEALQRQFEEELIHLGEEGLMWMTEADYQ